MILLRPLSVRKSRHLCRVELVTLGCVISSTGLLLGWPLLRALRALQATNLMPEFCRRYCLPAQHAPAGDAYMLMCSALALRIRRGP